MQLENQIQDEAPTTRKAIDANHQNPAVETTSKNPPRSFNVFYLKILKKFGFLILKQI